MLIPQRFLNLDAASNACARSLMAYTYTAKIRDRGIGDSSLLYTVIIIIATSIGSQKCLISLWYIGVMTCFTKGYRLSISEKNTLPS